MKRSPRPVFALVLSLLLVGMQLDGAVHKLGHVGQWLKHAHQQSLYTPNDEPCAECLLLASGAHALSGTAVEPPVALAPQERSRFLPAPFEPAFRSFYLSRAPPVLL